MKSIIFQLILFCCMIPNMLAQNKIKQYEYWLDNDYAGRQTVSITPTANLELTVLPANSLIKQGLHRLNVRFQDTNNKYSAVLTQFVEGFTANPQINSCEYWFDDLYTNKTIVPLTSSPAINLNNIDISAIPNGMHTFNIRFFDRAAKWSAVQTAKLYKSGGNAVLVNTVAGYRYWFDSDFGKNVYKSLSSSLPVLSSTETLDLTGFPKGNNHIFNIQFKDALGLWGAVQSTGLCNSGAGNVLYNAITEYRYWVDNGFTNSMYKTVNPALAFVSLDENIDLSLFKGNNRMLYVQFKDALGMWSSVLKDTVNVVSNVGLNDVESGPDIYVYPNPSKGKFTISTHNTLNDVSIYILNTLGKAVYLERFGVLEERSLDLTDLPAGVYFMRIIENNNPGSQIIRKIILQH